MHPVAETGLGAEDARLIEGVLGGQRRALAKAITLAESSRPDHQQRAAAVLRERGIPVDVVFAGDDQMDPQYLPALLDPIVERGYGFTKANRFFSRGSFEGMPKYRVFGNIVLSFLTKLASGYWHLFDPQNGFLAARAEARVRDAQIVQRVFVVLNSAQPVINRKPVVAGARQHFQKLSDERDAAARIPAGSHRPCPGFP